MADRARREARAAATAVLTVVMTGAAAIAPAAAAKPSSTTTTFSGVIVVSGATGDRLIVNSVVVAKGSFQGTGTLVEVPNQPGDPDTVARDDLIFAGGTIHILSTNLDFTLSANPKSCVFNGL